MRSTTFAALAVLLSMVTYAEPLQVCLVSGSFEYDSHTSLEAFEHYLEQQFDVDAALIKAERPRGDDIPGLEALDTCDVALFFTRRQEIKGEQLARVRAYCDAGRPLVAVRTASHGFQAWLAFDRDVLGGNYEGHLGEGPTQDTQVVPSMREHPVFEGVGQIRSRYSLYKTRPLAHDAEKLMIGRTPFSDGWQPVTWTRIHNGGRVFYSSLGGLDDFKHAGFRRMLANALFWAAEKPVAMKPLPPVPPRTPRHNTLELTLRTRRETAEECVVNWDAAETAVIICDMWDKHWCDFASQRVAEMAPRMNEVVSAARDAGVFIVHAPSETLGFYADHPARRRMQQAPPAEPPTERALEEPPLPIDDSDGGCPEDQVQYGAWTRQQPAIEIHDEDGISDDGREMHSFFAQAGIKHVIIMGVHTNMCVVGRSFGIRQMRRWGYDVVLARDLTDTMYNPAMPPHVPHNRGTELVVQHIERHLCPSITGDALVRACAGNEE